MRRDKTWRELRAACRAKLRECRSVAEMHRIVREHGYPHDPAHAGLHKRYARNRRRRIRKAKGAYGVWECYDRLKKEAKLRGD